jgi:t-SNARE complex subunit (syntaxin)
MYRRHFAEKIIKKHQDIKEIQTETEDVFYLFEELREEVESSNSQIETIEDYIQTCKEEVKTTEEINCENTIQIKSDQKTKLIISTILGVGVGSLFFIYNPYVAIGTSIGGGMIGIISNYF